MHYGELRPTLPADPDANRNPHPDPNQVSWAYSARHLSLHGLWPAYAVPRDKGGDRPSPSPLDCAVKAALAFDQLPREYIDLAPAFTKWNNELHRAEVGQLARHEWQKHGTCSGLNPPQYFEEALRAMQAPRLTISVTMITTLASQP